ncbi:PAS domain S-box protein [Mariniflexile gromovii]|uniref:PAS domain S-box protein n=1 Tax=Mariniflexile gromovii TaxID=362523 RepID=A0ABS4BZ49_9FLAO|nr:PAS domain S-box protein [Mariniflexile gromovii]MBP0905683.1 PAS domain S-box protein [Mariniflexile gromovii]
MKIPKDSNENSKEEEMNFFVSLFQNSPIPKTISSVTTKKYVFVNSAWETFTGYSNSEAINKTVYGLELVSIEDGALIREKLLKNKEIISYKCSIKLKNGLVKKVSLSFYVIVLNGEEFVLNTINNLERQSIYKEKQVLNKKKEQVLLAQNFNVDSIESMTDGFLSLNNDWNYTYVNKSAAFMLGRKAEDLIGKHIWTEFPEIVGLPFYTNYHKAADTQQIISFENYYHPWDRWFDNRVIPSKDGVSVFFQDITERKKARELLIKNQKYLDNIINNIGDPLMVKDSESRLLLVNDAFCSFFNLPKDDIIGKTLAEDVPQDERDGFLKIDREVLLTGVENINEETFTFKGQEKRIISTKKTRFTDDAGNKFLIGIIRDITERKKAEEEIMMAHQRLTTHLNNSPLAIIEWDKDLIIQKWSTKAKNIFGWEESEAVGKHFNDLNMVYEDDVEAITVIANELMGGEVKNNKIVNRNYTKTKKVIYCEWYNSVLQSPDGQIETIFSLVHDITGRVTMEMSLKESEEKFSKAFKSNVIGKAILNKEKKIVEVNEALANMVGFKRENMLNKTAEEIGLFNLDDINNLENEKLLWSQFSEKGYVSNIELKYLMHDGRFLFISISLQALQLHGEEHVLITVLDITEKKIAEAELENHRNNLEELVKIRTEEVNVKNVELQRMNKLFVGRELKMKELKNIIKELQSKK